MDGKPGAAAPSGCSAGLMESPKVWSSVVFAFSGARSLGVIISVTPCGAGAALTTDNAARRRAEVLMLDNKKNNVLKKNE
jgi:hypothetical protein